PRLLSRRALVSARRVEPCIRTENTCTILNVPGHEPSEIATVSLGHRHLLVDVGAVDQLAPFLVIEEEKLILNNRAADVEAIHVIAELALPLVEEVDRL